MTTSSEQIPDKIFFSISEVSALLGLRPHVLRYWEKEFPFLAPEKDKSGQRRYRNADIQQLIRIQELLHEKKFTIAGARMYLRGSAGVASMGSKGSGNMRDVLLAVRDELAALRDTLTEY